MNKPPVKIESPLPEAEADPRQRILEAAYGIFAEKGREGARTREIAKAAGVNPAMLHYYFSSKEELYVRVLTPIFETLLGRLKSAINSSEEPRERIKAVVDVYFDFLKAHPEVPRLIMWDMVTGGNTIHKTLITIFTSDRDGLRAMLRDTFVKVQKGRAKPRNPDQYMISLVALCVFPFIASPFLRAINPDLVHWPEFLKERQSHILDLLLGGTSQNQKSTG